MNRDACSVGALTTGSDGALVWRRDANGSARGVTRTGVESAPPHRNGTPAASTITPTTATIAIEEGREDSTGATLGCGATGGAGAPGDMRQRPHVRCSSRILAPH